MFVAVTSVKTAEATVSTESMTRFVNRPSVEKRLVDVAFVIVAFVTLAPTLEIDPENAASPEDVMRFAALKNRISPVAAPPPWNVNGLDDVAFRNGVVEPRTRAPADNTGI